MTNWLTFKGASKPEWNQKPVELALTPEQTKQGYCFKEIDTVVGKFTWPVKPHVAKQAQEVKRPQAFESTVAPISRGEVPQTVHYPASEPPLAAYVAHLIRNCSNAEFVSSSRIDRARLVQGWYISFFVFHDLKQFHIYQFCNCAIFCTFK